MSSFILSWEQRQRGEAYKNWVRPAMKVFHLERDERPISIKLRTQVAFARAVLEDWERAVPWSAR